MRWSPKVLQIANQMLSTTMGATAGESLPPYIAVHIRRSDFIAWCFGVPRDECLAPLEAYARRVEEVKTEMLERKQIASGDEVKVILMSDEPRDGIDRGEPYWERVAKLGWLSIDHDALETGKNLGHW